MNKSITDMIREITCKTGHSFLTKRNMISEMCDAPDWDEQDFEAALETEIANQTVVKVDDRYYLPSTFRAETILTEFLSDALRRIPEKLPPIASVLSVNGIELNKEQNRAVRMALVHRLSMIQGGAGTGKTTIVQAIVQSSGDPTACLLCAFTARAAQNLSEGIGMSASTIHSALGVSPDGDLTKPKRSLSQYRTIIVDEASMLTIELLAGIVAAASDSARIILIGDSQQLPPVGGGDVIKDLRELGVPCITLKQIYRQSIRTSALFQNVSRFHKMRESSMFRWDGSFQLVEADEDQIEDLTVAIAQYCYQLNPSTVALSPFRKGTELSSFRLSHSIQVSIQSPSTPSIMAANGILYERDRVMFNTNNRAENYYNGQFGTLECALDEWGDRVWSVKTPSGQNIPVTETALQHIDSAYAMTVHKAQGSSFDVVILPLTMRFSVKLTRNLLYTAISRAKNKSSLLEIVQSSTMPLPLPRRNGILSWWIGCRMCSIRRSVDRLQSVCCYSGTRIVQN